MAVVALPIPAKQLEVEPLFTEELLLVLPAGHDLEQARSITAERVDGYPFVMLNEAHCLTDNIASFCRRKAVQPVTVERTSQLATVQELVAMDHGVSMVPELARRTDSSARRVYRSFTGEKPTRTVAMMWDPSRSSPGAVLTLMEHLRKMKKPQANPQQRGATATRP